MILSRIFTFLKEENFDDSILIVEQNTETLQIK